MKGKSLLLAVSAAVQIGASAAFLSPNIRPRPQIINHQLRQDSIFRKNAAADDSENTKADAKEEKGLGFTALPPIGGSSFWDHDTDADTTAYTNDNDTSSTGQKNIIINAEHTNLVSPKFQLQYTCKICSTRNSHSVTRMAYRKGVVIAVCKGCHSKHLIADNLGWSNYVGGFDFDNGETDIETYMQNQAAADGSSIGTVVGENENELVTRVTQDVFDLETMVHKGRENGNVMSGGNNGIADGEDMNDETSWS